MPRWTRFDVFYNDPPQVGNVMMDPSRGVHAPRYLVTEARPVESRQWHDRWALTLRRLGADEPNPPGAVVREYYMQARPTCTLCLATAHDIVVPDGLVHGAGCELGGST